MLSVILSYSELLAKELKPSDPMRDDVHEITDAGLRAADLTRQLLAFSRQQVLQPRIVNLNQVFDGMEKMLRRVIGEDICSRPCVRPRGGLAEQVTLRLS